MRQFTLRHLAVFGIAALSFAGSGNAQEATDQATTKLFNGWSISPAGTPIPLEHLQTLVPGADLHLPLANATADLPLKMIVSPDGKMLIAACAGYNTTGLAVLDLATNKLTQFIPMPKIWNGLAFSRDGSKLYVSGGDSGKLFVYAYKSGKLTAEKDANPSPAAKHVFLAGIAVHPEDRGALHRERGQSRGLGRESRVARGGVRDPDRAASALLRLWRRRRASLRFQLGQPQREHHRHEDRRQSPRRDRRHPAQRHGRSRPMAGSSWPVPATTRST